MANYQTAQDRKQVEKKLLDQMQSAAEAYRVAKENNRKIKEDFGDLPLGHADGNFATRRAAATELATLEEYRQSLKNFTNLVIGDRQPDSGEPANDSDESAFASLTPREREVLRHIVNGQSSKEIACALGISFKTAVTHRASIMGKLNVHEVASLVRKAVKHGLS